MKKLWSDFIYNLRGMRTQMFFILLCLGILPIIFLFNLITNEYHSQLISQRTDELQSYGTVIANLVTSSGYLSGQESSEVENETEEVANVYQGRIILVNKDLKVVRDTYNIENGKTMVSTEVIKCFSDDSGMYVNNLGDYMQLTMPIVDPISNETTGAIIISYSTKNIQSISKAVTRKVIFAICAIVLIIMLISFGYSIFLTTPLNKLTDSINEISKGNMAVKLDMHGYSELHKITDSFNKMIEVIQNQENSRQEFVSNVSHELKTPLASMKVLSDSLLSQEGMPEEIYREFLGDITTEIERMTQIINDLLSMVKLDQNAAKIIISNISINELIEQLLKRLRPIAAERNIELIFESFRPVIADVDELKFASVATNLVENAIKYNNTDGTVTASLNSDHQYFYLKVTDTGIGISEENQDRVFERFFRVDKARSRETGGTGLGLAITKEIVMKHHGSIKIHSKEGEGTTFTVRIPLKYIA